MVQRFKLRLGDGTVLLVDHDGLSTWLVDRKAMVQAGRSGKWIPLREFLVHLRAAAQREARRQAAVPEEREQAAVPEEREQAAVPEEREQAADREERMRAAAREERRRAAAREERRRAAARGGQERAVSRETPPPATATSAREDGLPLVPPPTRDAGLTPPQGDDGPEEEAPPPSPPPADEFEVPLDLGATSESAADVKISVGEPRLVEDGRPGVSTGPAPTDADEPAAIGEPPGVQALADEPAPGAHGSGSTPVDDVPVVPLKPLEDEGPGRPPKPTLEAEPPSVMVRPGVQSLADDPGVPPARRTGSTWTGATWDDDPPVIPLKPPDEREATRRGPARPRSGAAPSFADDTPGKPILTDGPAASVLRAVGTFGAFLSRCLAPINRLERSLSPVPVEEPRTEPVEPWEPPSAPKPPRSSDVRPPEIHPLAEEPTPRDDEPQRPSTDDSLPIIPLKPLHDGLAELSTGTRRLFVRARGWGEGLTARLARRLRREPPQESISSEPWAAEFAPTPPPAHAEPREALEAPPPAIGRLPVLRFAPMDEPRGVEDIYEEDEGESESVVSVLWIWTKRLVWATALLAVGALAVMNRDVWLPQATQIGEHTLTEIDERVRSGHFARQQQEAVQKAARELPHLAPETIRLIMASSPIRVLDAPDVFEIASEAADRGRSALAPGEARELEGLREDLLLELGPEERVSFREFDRARARGTAFPFDFRQGMRLYARGARELPAESRERLQELFGQAIAAGLAHPSEIAPTGRANGS